jgi:glycerol-3-phosphate acyltransferase PlsX
MYTDKYDVMVCDGFVGNVLLKSAEGFYHSLIKERGITDSFFEEFNHENQGGTPVLGINKPVLIGHGMANEVAIKAMLLDSRKVINAKLEEKFKEIFENDKN